MTLFLKKQYISCIYYNIVLIPKIEFLFNMKIKISVGCQRLAYSKSSDNASLFTNWGKKSLIREKIVHYNHKNRF